MTDNFEANHSELWSLDETERWITGGGNAIFPLKLIVCQPRQQKRDKNENALCSCCHQHLHKFNL